MIITKWLLSVSITVLFINQIVIILEKEKLEKKIKIIDNYRKRIEKSNFEDYCNLFYKKECEERERKIKFYKEV